MKKCLLILCMLSASFSYGTHLMGGDITVYPDSLSDGSYYVKVVHYRDTVGVPAYPTLTMWLLHWNTAMNTWSDTFKQTLLYLDSSQSGQNLPNFPYGVQVYTYTTKSGSPLALPPGKYRADVGECCRNGAIMNMTNALGEALTLLAEFVVPAGGSNTSPQFLAMPIVYLPVNQPWAYNPVPYDVDGDSISWAISIPTSGTGSPNFDSIIPVQGYTMPPASSTGPFSLNPVTGEVTWTPNTIGHFVASFKITEYKNGIPSGYVIRDMQYVVISSPVPGVSFTNVTYVQTNAASGYNFINYEEGQPLQFKIQGGDSSTGTMSMECFSGLFKNGNLPSFSYTATGNGNMIEGVFNWTPPPGMTKDAIVVFRLRNSTFSKDFTLVLHNGIVTGISELPPNPVTNLVAYPNPATNTLHVSLQSTKDADLGLQVTDVTGRTVRQLYKGAIKKGLWKMSFDLHGAAGIYFLNAISGGKVIATERISVIR